jgi:hypothetical protein
LVSVINSIEHVRQIREGIYANINTSLYAAWARQSAKTASRYLARVPVLLAREQKCLNNFLCECRADRCSYKPLTILEGGTEDERQFRGLYARGIRRFVWTR